MRRRALVALAVLTCGVAHANPSDIMGFGSRGAGMANIGVATADDASANYYNPAGLVRTDQLHIDLSYQLGKPYLQMNGRDSHVNEARGLAVGVDAPGHIGPFRFAIGVGLWLPDQQLTRTRQIAFEQPRWVYYDNRPQRLVLSANLAIQIWRGIYIGAGINYMSKTQGTLLLRGTVDPITTEDSALVSNIGVDLVAVRYPQAGLLWEATKYLTIGLVYRHRFVLSVDQSFRIEGDIGVVGSNPIVADAHVGLHTQSMDHFHPWQLVLAGALRLSRAALVSVELTYAAWHDFQTPASRVTFDVDVKQFNDRVNLPAPRDFPLARFHDIVIPRIGFELRTLDRPQYAVDVRGGYAYEASPVPQQFAASNYVDSDKHTLTIGGTFELKRAGGVLLQPWSFDLNLGVTALPPRVDHKQSPVDPIGDIRATGAVLQVGCGFRSRF